MSESRTGGIGFFGLLTIVFITLKLTNYIDWSWWWVLSPLFVPVIIIFAILVIMLVMGARVRQRRKR
jgi:Flp pilus assembly protein TadB